MAVTRKTYKSAEEILAARIDALEAQVKSLQNAKVPTVPIYDESNFPAQAVYGQLAMGSDNNIYNYGADDIWHVPAGTGTITEIDSTDGSISVSNPNGPIVDLSVSFPAALHNYESTHDFGASGFTATTVPSNTWTILDWTRDATLSNAALLDHTVSNTPSILADGVYAFSMTARDNTVPPSTSYSLDAYIVLNPGGASPRDVSRGSAVSFYAMVPPNTFYTVDQGNIPLSFTRFLAAGTKIAVYGRQSSGTSGAMFLTGTTTFLSV